MKSIITKVGMVFLLVLTIFFTTPISSSFANDASNKYDQSINDLPNEIIELRDMFSRSLKNEDGTITVFSYMEPINFKDKSGEYHVIRNDIIEKTQVLNNQEYKFSNTANSWSAMFRDIDESKSAVMISDSEKTITFSVLDSFPSKVKKATDSINNKTLEELVSLKDTVIYENVFPNIDITYTVTNTGVKENIILIEPTLKNRFLFGVKTNELYCEDKDGLIVFYDKDGKETFFVNDLWAIDSNGIKTNKVSCKLTKTDNDYVMEVIVDKDYLADSNRKWPVIIDPTFSIWPSEQAAVCSNYPSYNDTSRLGTGRDSFYGIVRSFFRFTPPVPDYVNVTNATLRFNRVDGNGPVNITVYPCSSSWSSSSITWNNMPSYYTNPSYYVASVSGSQYAADITSYVQAIMTGFPNYGMMIKDVNESDENIWSEWSSPYLEVTYTQPSYEDKIKHLDEDRAIYFMWFSDIGPLPWTWSVCNNLTYEYSEYTTGFHNARKISMFSKVDQNNNPEMWQVNTVIVGQFILNNTTYQDLIFDDNVLVSPDWVWDNKYKRISVGFNPGVKYTVVGTSVVYLTYDCVPAAHTITTTLSMN